MSKSRRKSYKKKSRRKSKLRKFEGTVFNSLSAMYYLNYLHGHENCFIILSNSYDKSKSHKDISIRWIHNKGISSPEEFWPEFDKHYQHCLQKLENNIRPFIVFTFGFSCLDSGHANIIIFDVYNKCLERFDSVVYKDNECLNVSNLDIKILTLFQNKGYDIQNIITPKDIRASFQLKQEAEKIRRIKSDPQNGFCSAWSCFYADLRLTNPIMDINTLINKTEVWIEQNYNSYTEFIRLYSQNIVIIADSLLNSDCI